MPLLIRDAQLAALREPQVRAFVARVMRHVERFFPARAGELGDHLEGFVEHGLTRAEQHGLSSERHVCRYIGLMCVAGRDFDREGFSKSTLGSTALSPDEKLALLTAAILEREGAA